MKQNIKKFTNTILITIGIPSIYLIMIRLMTIIFYKLYYIKYNCDELKVIEMLMKNTFIRSFLAGLLILLLLIVFFSKTNESLIKRCNLKPIKFNKILYIIIFIIGFSFLDTFFINLLAKNFKSYEIIDRCFNSINMGIMQILSVSILCPIIEEIVFRGVIFGFLRKNYNIIIAIILQALVFSIFHHNMLQSIYTFGLGIVLALINIYGNSLYGNILAHILYNIFGVFVIPILPGKISFCTYMLIGLIMFSFGTIKIINSRTKFQTS